MYWHKAKGAIERLVEGISRHGLLTIAALKIFV